MFVDHYDAFVYLRWNEPTISMTNHIRWLGPITVKGLTDRRRTRKAFQAVYAQYPELKGMINLF